MILPNPPFTVAAALSINMKLVIGGSTGFVATELIRQGLENPAITSIVALGRRENPAPLVTPKLKFVVCDNFESYPNSVEKELENADACIWYAYPTFHIRRSSIYPFHIRFF